MIVHSASERDAPTDLRIPPQVALPRVRRMKGAGSVASGCLDRGLTVAFNVLWAATSLEGAGVRLD